MASPEEKVKVILDISDVVVKRAAEIKEAQKAEKEKIAALKREAAAAAKEEKAAFDFAVKLAKQEEAERTAAAKRIAAEEAKAQKYLADIKAKYFEQEQKQREQAEREAARAARGPSEWTLALKANTDAMNAQKGAINQSAEAMGRVASVASALDPALGTVVATGQKLVGMMSAGVTAAQGLGATLGTVGAVAGPLALAVGAVALAWQDYEADIAAAEEATRKAREEQEKMIEAMGGVRSLLSSNASEVDRLKVNYGELSEEQFQLNELGRRWSDSLATTRAPLEKLREELLRTNDASSEHAAKLVAVEDALRDANTAAAIGYEAARQNLEIEQERAESERVLAERLREREEAERLSTEAAREKAKADQEAERIAAERAARNKAFVEDNIRKAEEEKARLDDLRQTYEANGAAREEQYNRDQENIAKTIAAEKALQKERINNASLVASTASDIASAIGSLYEAAFDRSESHVEDLQEKREEALEDGNQALVKALDKQIAAEKEAAMEQWEAQHKLAIAAAWLDLAASVSKASTAAPWPFNLIAMAGAAATGAANVALVTQQEPPEFDDTPQVMQTPQNNRTNVSLKGGDLFAAAQTPEGLKKQVDSLTGRDRMRTADRMNSLFVGRSLTHDLRLVMGRA